MESVDLNWGEVKAEGVALLLARVDAENMTHADFADKSGLGLVQVSKMLAGEVEPSDVEQFNRALAVFGASVKVMERLKIYGADGKIVGEHVVG